jgi:hypothetical protein
MSRLRFAVLLLVASPTAAADKLPPELALVPPDAAAFVSVRGDRVIGPVFAAAPLFGDGKDPGLLSDFERRWLGFPAGEVERVTAVYPTAPTRESPLPVFIVTRSKPVDRVAVLRKLQAHPVTARDPFGKEATGRGLFDLQYGGRFAFLGDRSLLLTDRANTPGLLKMIDRKPDPAAEAPLGPALAAAAGDKNVLAAGATGVAFKALVGAWPARDRDFAALGRALTVTVVADLEPDLRAAVRAEFADPVTAREGQAALTALAGWAADFLKDRAAGSEKTDAELARLALAALGAVGQPRREGKAVTAAVRMKADDVAALGRAATARVQLSADRLRSSNNLKQIGLAIHNVHDTYGEFPFAARNTKWVHPGLSWRVALLPFIEQDNLYKQFKLDEPWDSEANKKFIDKMPRVFAPPKGVEAKPGHTFYRMFDGPGTVFRMKSIVDIMDGTSNTLMVVEAGEPVIWTKPDEPEFDPKKPLPKLGGHFADGLNVLFADGSTRFLRKSLDEKTLKALITADGKEDVSLGKD